MKSGASPANSPALSVDSAASKLEGFFSDMEDTEPTEPQGADDRETPADAPTPEVTDDAEPSEPAEPAEPTEADGEEPVESDEPDDAKPEPRKRRIKVDGEEIEVTEDEAYAGYSRTADYTRKTQALAEERKRFETEELTAVRAERQQYATQLRALEQALTEVTPQEPDWDALRQENPAEFAQVWAMWDQHTRQIEAVRAERERADAAVQRDQQTRQQQVIAEEQRKLLEAVPEWKKPETRQAEQKKLVEYARTLGFSDAEIKQVSDHRALLMLRKAMLHDAAQAAKPAVQRKIEEKTVKVAPPGASDTVQRKKPSPAAQARQRLVRSGRIEDGAAAIMDMIED